MNDYATLEYTSVQRWLLELLGRKDRGFDLLADDDIGKAFGFRDDHDKTWHLIPIEAMRIALADGSIPEPYATALGGAVQRQELIGSPRGTTYFLYENQGGGCDYSIACGQRLRMLRGPVNMRGALATALTSDYLGCEPGEDYGPISTDPGESALQSAEILEVSRRLTIDLDKYIEQARLRKADKDREAKERAEWEEYERLREKYGDKA